MSILQLPRIHFKGQMSWDPIVTNNYPKFYDEDNAQTVLTPTESMKQFRQAAIEAAKGGNWNPDGTHRAAFFETSVTAVDLGHGAVTTDKLCGAPALLNAMLVDLEPYGACTSQLFFDTLRFGIDGGCRIVAPRNERFTARYINFGRNSFGFTAGGASVNWQTTFATAGLTINSHGSDALHALQQALYEPDALGLVVSFNAYRTIYFDDPTLQNGVPIPVQKQRDLLYKKLIAGGFQPNPARSLIVGTIGVWRKGEAAHEPSDRALLPDANAKAFVATAHARIDRGHVNLDLSNSISETGAALIKQDLGTLQVVAVDAASKKEYQLASFNYPQYDHHAYEASAGIVSVPLNPALSAADLAHAELADWQLRSSKEGLLLSESATRIIPQSPNLYLDQGPAGNTKMQVYLHGKPLHKISDITVYQTDAAGQTITGTQELKTNAQGQLVISANASAGQVYAYLPLIGKNLPPPDLSNGIDTQTYTYAYVRVLPADSATAALPPTWDNVYKNVLINWNAMAPCMDNWLDLANPVQVHNYASILHRLTDPKAFESYLFMPVTRDMTVGQRSLLNNFLKQALPHPVELAEKIALPTLAAAAPAPAATPVSDSIAPQQQPTGKPNFAELSRSLRNVDHE
ncbi:hypothetical protein [Undibacterium sp. Ji49W]|uniref:hypothetical protein n=1 Tax=Undibacterium sp. Ji49W TaxID=3413040 RepID=UPI003BF3CEA3